MLHFVQFADCDVSNGGCDHMCSTDKTDEWCSCENGYQVSSEDWKKCLGWSFDLANTLIVLEHKILISDINECNGTRGVDYNKECHVCSNTQGSYTCICASGFKIDSISRQTCIGMSSSLVILSVHVHFIFATAIILFQM